MLGKRWLWTAMLCFPAVAPAQNIIRGEANLLHREPLRYPEEALQFKIEGTLVVETTLNERGVVSDAHIKSGPLVFRKTALRSILEWHYAPGTPSPVEVVVEFKLPAPRPVLLNGQAAPTVVETSADPAAGTGAWDAGIVKEIQFVNLSSATEQVVLSRLPVQRGDSFRVDMVKRIGDVLRDVDEHLISNFDMVDFDGERRHFALRIFYQVRVEGGAK